MNKACKKTIEKLIRHFNYDCTVYTFKGYKGKSWL